MEITKKNFNDEMGNITNNLKHCCFIGFDAEFSGLLTGESYEYRLFDTNQMRYDLIKSEVSNLIMTQVGLTTFTYERDSDTYNATSYTFHLTPQSFGAVNQMFTFQASTLSFLCRHGFDFNKFIYEGLPYMSQLEEDAIHQQIKDGTLLANLTQGLELDDRRLLQNKCSEVSKWLSSSKEGTTYVEIENPLLRYILHNEIRIRFPTLLTVDSLGNSHKILIYRDKSIEGANSAPMAVLEEKLLNHLLGFTLIIKLLEQYKKPIIGHNTFMDTVLLHNQFIGPLPKKYSEFKKNINKMFPNIYDTKYISIDMAKKLSFNEVWKSNVLQDLYEFFAERKCARLNKGTNLVVMTTTFNVNQSYHEAGWDSYCSGYCFLRLGHWAACENSGHFKAVGPSEKLAALQNYCNKVNVIRGAVPYMNLAGDDPPSHRPTILHLESLKESFINIGKIATLLADCGSSTDIKRYGHRTALIASNTANTSNRILKLFRNNQEYKISIFSVYRHSPVIRMTMWGSALITGSLVLYLIHHKIKT